MSRFPKLQGLTLAGGISGYKTAFFESSEKWHEYSWFYSPKVDETNHGKYAPETFDEAAQDLANGCRTLDIVTMGNVLGELLIKDGLSARIIRKCDGGGVEEVKRIRAWGRVIGKEEEWE